MVGDSVTTGLTKANGPSSELRINRTNKLKNNQEKKRAFTEPPEYSLGFPNPLMGLGNHGDGCTAMVLEGDPVLPARGLLHHPTLMVGRLPTDEVMGTSDKLLGWS